MKKLILALGLLVCTSAIVHGMENVAKAHLWTQIVGDIRQEAFSPALKPLMDASPEDLNAPSPLGLYLLPVLLYNTTDAADDRCAAVLSSLLKNKGLNLTATDKNGNLLCNDVSLEDEHKQRLIQILADNNIPNPFTQTNDPIDGITFHPKSHFPFALISVTNYKLWIATATLAVVAAVLYKWRTKKIGSPQQLMLANVLS
jgi:hypothetical protein